MNMKRVNFLSHFVLVSLLCSCANMSTLQTARALPEKRYRLNLGGGLFSFPDLKTSSSSTEGTSVTHASTLPYLEFGGRLGVSKGFDAGAKLTFPMTLAVDGKYQFVDGKEFASAIGLGLSYIAVTASPNSSSGVDAKAIDATLPLYLSYDLSPSFGFYGSPKFVFRQVLGTESKNYQLAGGTLGMRLGNESGVFLEGTVMKYLNASTNTAYQVNASFFFGDAPSVPRERHPHKNTRKMPANKNNTTQKATTQKSTTQKPYNPKPKKDETSVLE